MSLGFMRPAHQARLERFVELARVYRGWTRIQLAERLGRDPSHIVPAAGNAKLGFLRRIADALDWDVRDVVESVANAGERFRHGLEREGDSPHAGPAGYARGAERTRSDGGGKHAGSAGNGSAASTPQGDDEGARPPRWAGASFEKLDHSAIAAHRGGRFEELMELIEAMREVAATPTERAVVAIREIGAWDMRGRYVRALESAHEGIALDGVEPAVQIMLQANLAQVHMTLWHLVEAQAVASEVIKTCEAEGATPRPSAVRERGPRIRASRSLRVSAAFARFVRGGALCRAIDHEIAPGREVLAERARADLVAARDRYDELTAEFGEGQYAAMAHTCRASLLECDAALDDVAAIDAVHIVMERLGEAADLGNVPGGDWLESFGWWAIAGCTIALRHLDGHELHRAMAVCTNKALEIADRLDHWALRERAFTMERFRRQRVEDATGCEPEWLLDDEDVRMLAGTMGRFPTFRAAGWRILESARLFSDLESSEVSPFARSLLAPPGRTAGAARSRDRPKTDSPEVTRSTSPAMEIARTAGAAPEATTWRREPKPPSVV